MWVSVVSVCGGYGRLVERGSAVVIPQLSMLSTSGNSCMYDMECVPKERIWYLLLCSKTQVYKIWEIYRLLTDIVFFDVKAGV
jgi:hypothetical protein